MNSSRRAGLIRGTPVLDNAAFFYALLSIAPQYRAMPVVPVASLNIESVSGPYRFALPFHNWVVKFPRRGFYRQGLRANRRERRFAFDHSDCGQLCPVLLADPFGLFLVTPRVRPLALQEAAQLGALELVDLFTLPNEFLPGDPSRSRVGVLNGHLVVTDFLDHQSEGLRDR